MKFAVASEAYTAANRLTKDAPDSAFALHILLILQGALRGMDENEIDEFRALTVEQLATKFLPPLKGA